MYVLVLCYHTEHMHVVNPKRMCAKGVFVTNICCTTKRQPPPLDYHLLDRGWLFPHSQVVPLIGGWIQPTRKTPPDLEFTAEIGRHPWVGGARIACLY